MAMYIDDEYKEAVGTSSGLFEWSNPPPISSSGTGVQGALAYDDDYLYIAVDNDRWIRMDGTKNWTV